MPVPYIALRCCKEGCIGTVYYDRAAAAFAPCGRCGNTPKDVNEWFAQALSADLDLSKFPYGSFSIAWFLDEKLGKTDAEEPKEFDALNSEDHKLIGDYSDVLNKDGIAAANEFLDRLPHEPSPAVEKLLRTVRLLNLAASAR